MKRNFVLIILSFLMAASSALAADLSKVKLRFNSQENFQGFVQVRSERSLFVDYSAPKSGQPTVILLNGLTYSTRQWDDFASHLIERGVGVLRFDFDGMGKTLLRYAPYTEPIPVERQASDLHTLLEQMSIQKPYNLVGLSYGGGAAAAFVQQFPDDVKNVIVMAPFTQPVDGQDKWIKAQIWATRAIFPYNQMTDDELYDYYLHQIIYATYPQAEPIVLENPFKLEAVFRLIQGIRKYRPGEHTSMIPPRSLHLMIGGQDQYIARSVLDQYWDSIPQSARASKIVIHGCEHKIPEAMPRFSAGWVYQIITNNVALFEGNYFEGYPFLGKAVSEKDTVEIK